MIKLIASDIDGTLINNNKEFSPDFGEILEQLNNQDVMFVAASGRSRYSLQKEFQKFGERIFYISDNGGYVSDDKEDYFVHKMKKQEVDDIMKLLLPIQGIQIILCGKHKAYFPNFQKDFFKDVVFYYNEYAIIDDYRKINDDFIKIAVFDSRISAENTHPKIKDKLPANICSVVSSVNWLDIMDKSVSKGAGIEKLQKKFNITPDETMAFGDFFNDISMFEKAKYSYAMENACNKVKECANFVAPENDKFGVCEIIKKQVINL